MINTNSYHICSSDVALDHLALRPVSTFFTVPPPSTDAMIVTRLSRLLPGVVALCPRLPRRPFGHLLGLSVLLAALSLLSSIPSCRCDDGGYRVQHNVWYNGLFISGIAVDEQSGDVFFSDAAGNRVIHQSANGSAARRVPVRLLLAHAAGVLQCDADAIRGRLDNAIELACSMCRAGSMTCGFHKPLPSFPAPPSLSVRLVTSCT